MQTKKSQNFDDRRGVEQASMIILHYTGMKTGEEALERLCDPSGKVSAHYWIGEGGEIIRLVEDDKRAWHAGVAYWAGETDINTHAIGIEIVNPGHEFGYCEFPEEQIIAVSKLCQEKMNRYSISPSCVLAHSDVAPARKEDPGELFPWQRLAGQGVGLWPVPTDMDREAAQDMLSDHVAIDSILSEIGYDPSVGFSQVLIAFHRHYYPEIFKSNANPAEPDLEGVARALALLRLLHGTKLEKNC